MEAKIPIEADPTPPVIPPPVDEEYDVKFCCLNGARSSCDKGFLEWCAKTLVSGSVLAFCFWQLANNNGSSEYYTSSISLIIGTYLGTHNNTPQKKTKES